jgi:malonyl CoA-acyl carrier protein transacylase
MKAVATGGSLLLFGGTGTPWWKILPAYRANPALRGFFRSALEALEEDRRLLDASPFSAFGSEMRDWIEGEARPQSARLHYCPIAVPMTFLIQMANAYLWKMEYRDCAPTDGIAGAIAHSQGIVSAVLMASEAGREWWDANRFKAFLRYFFRFSLRAQECFPFPEPDAEEKAEAANLGFGETSPMAALLGMDAAKVGNMIREFNAAPAGFGPVHLALINSPTSTVISATRKSLIAFLVRNAAVIKAGHCRSVFVKTSCPFHSPLLRGMEAPFLNDLAEIGFRSVGTELNFPVYSGRDGADYRGRGDLALAMCREMAMEKCEWGLSLIAAVRESRPWEILDFGPGAWCAKWGPSLLEAAGAGPIPILARQNETLVEK